MQKIPNDGVAFLHDRAPCMSALETQKLLIDKGIDFFGNFVRPGNSPDLNPTENLGGIVKQRVEENFFHFGRSSALQEMKEAFSVVIDELSRDPTLLQSLLKSMRRRLDAVQTSGGGYTKYYNFCNIFTFFHILIPIITKNEKDDRFG